MPGEGSGRILDKYRTLIRRINKGEISKLNIIIGIIFIIGGLSGNLVFIGTDSGVLLAVVGVVLVIWGGFRLYQKRRK